MGMKGGGGGAKPWHTLKLRGVSLKVCTTRHSQPLLLAHANLSFFLPSSFKFELISKLKDCKKILHYLS